MASNIRNCPIIPPILYLSSKNSLTDNFEFCEWTQSILLQHTLDNKSTKKYLLKSKGRTLDDVSSKMKHIESSLGLDAGSRTDLQDINGVILELEGEIKVKENQISEYDRHVMCSTVVPTPTHLLLSGCTSSSAARTTLVMTAQKLNKN